MTKFVRRRKHGMVGTYTTTSQTTKDDQATHQIEQYPEQNFHFSRSFDDSCDAIIVGEKKGYYQDQINGSISERRRAQTFAYEGEFIFSSSPVNENPPDVFPTRNECLPNGDTSLLTKDECSPNGNTSFSTTESKIKNTECKNLIDHTKYRIFDIDNDKQYVANDMLSSSISPGIKQSNDYISNGFTPYENLDNPSFQQIEFDSMQKNTNLVRDFKIQHNNCGHNLTHQKLSHQEKSPYADNRQHLRNSRIYQVQSMDNPKTHNRTRSSEGLENGDSNKRSSFFTKLRKTFSFDNIDLTSVKGIVFGNNKSCDSPLHAPKDSQQLSIQQNGLTERRRSFSTSDIGKIEGGRVCLLHKRPFSYEVRYTMIFF